MLFILVGFGTAFLSDKLIHKELDKSAMKKRRARRLRLMLIQLGETFVKLGQFLSARKDLLPVEITDELSLLQDQVPPFSFERVRKTIALDLGREIEEMFIDFEETPFAAASIGQVHLAKLSEDHTTVVVKVQRTNLSERFYQDLGCMRLFAHIGKFFRPESAWDDWLELSDEFGETLFQEINYIQEGKNADRLRRALRDSPEIRIPRVFWKYTGRRVLTLEFIPGTKIDDVQELNRENINLARLGNQLISCYMEQVLIHGFFHADPHAGNLSVDEMGNILIYDFGMTAEITKPQSQAIIGCITAIVNNDVDNLVKHLEILGCIKKDAKIEPITKALEPFIDYYHGKPAKDLDFTQLEHELDQIVLERSLILPANLAYLLKALSSIEGIARTLKPNFSFVEAAKPALRRWLLLSPAGPSILVKLLFNNESSGKSKLQEPPMCQNI
jgi:predicted unusual protein kinase regulating ubiquinone biosynthesis (AarF/ABC1/UbiB family)